MAKKPKKDAAPQEEAPAEKRGKKKGLLIGIAVAALLGAGVGGYALLGRGHAKAVEHEAAKKPATMLHIREMTVNLAAEPNQERPRFLKFSVALEVEDPKLVPEIQPLLPRVEDAFQVLVRQMRASDLEGSAGVYRLREELLRRVNIAVHPARIDAVLFKDLVVQ